VADAAALPVTAGAQQPERMRRIAVFMNSTADDPGSPIRAAAFVARAAASRLDRRPQRAVRRDTLLQAVNIIRLTDPDILGFKFAHDIGDLASIVDAEMEQRAARKREIL
jgi:hypothetical protein